MNRLKGMLQTGAMSRLNLILAGALIVQLALGAVVLWPREVASGPAVAAVPDLAAGDVTRLTLSDGQGESITLAQQTGQWVLPEADDYPLQADKVTALIDKLAQIKLDRPVTRTEASHKQLKLASDDHERMISLQTASGGHTLYLGSSPAYGSTHVRLDGQAEAYLTDALTVWDAATQASAWLDTLYLSVPVADITALALTNANGTYTLTRVDEATWQLGEGPQGNELDQAKATSLVQRAASLRLDKPLGRTLQPSWGLSAPQASITLTTAEQTITLDIGALIDDGAGYAIKSSDSPYAVRISSYVGDAFVQQTADDLLVTPTPAAPAQ